MTDNLSTKVWGDDYRRWLAALKQRVERARQRAAASINRELVTLYWQIGRDILERQQRQGWGARVVDRFLLELGAGFAFVGRQYRLDVGGAEIFIDLLFYHLKLRCYVVVELKSTPFKPEYAGQTTFSAPRLYTLNRGANSVYVTMSSQRTVMKDSSFTDVYSTATVQSEM